MAVSPDGDRAYALGQGRLQIIDLRARVVRAAVPLNWENSWLLRVAPSGERLFLVERDSYGRDLTLDVLDADAAVERRVSLPLPAQAWSAFVAGFAFDAGGDRAWVLISVGADAVRQLWIYAVDLATGGVVAQVRAPAAGATYFGAAAIDPARGVAFVATDDGDRDEVRTVELATGAVLARLPLPAGALPFWDAARERLFAWTYAIEPTTEREETALFALDPERARARRLATFAGWPQALALAPDGTWWVGLGEPSPRTVLVDSNSGGVLGEIAAAGGIGGQAFAPGLPDAPPPPPPSPTPAAAQSYRAVVLSSGAHTVTEIDTGSAATVSVRIAHEFHDAIPIGASADAETLYGITHDTLLTYHVGSGETFARRFANVTSEYVLQRGVATPDGSRVFVGTWASVGEVDLHLARASTALGFGGDEVDALALAAAGRRLLVATERRVYDIDQGALHVVDPVGWRDLASVDFPGRAIDLAAGSDGRAWIATGEAVVAVDLSTAEIAAIVPVAADSVAVSVDGARVFAAGAASWQGVPPTLTAIDASSLRVAGAVVVADAGAVADLALTPDGQRALLAIDGTPARVAVVDLGRLETVGMVRVGMGPRAVAIAAEPWTPPPLPPPSPLPRRPAGDLHPCMLVPLGAGEEAPSGAIALLDPTRHGVAGLIPVGESSPDGNDATAYDGVSAVVADPDGTRLYATVPSHRGGAGHLAAIDPTTGEVIGRLPVGIAPWSVALSADGRRALVANWNGYPAPPSLSIVDLDGWRVLDEVALPEGARGIQPSADGQLLYVRTQQRQYLDGRDVYDDRLVAIDPRSGAVAFAIPLSVSHEPAGDVAVLPDGRTLLAEIGTDDGYYTPEPEIVAVLDLATRAAVARIEIPFTSWNSRAYGSAAFAVSPDGGEVYRGTGANPGTATVLDPVARRLLAQIPVEHGFGPPAFTADGAFVFGNSGGGVAVIDTATRRLAAEVPLGGSAGRVVAAMLDAPCEATPAATPTPDPAPPSPTAAPPWPPTPTWSGAWVDLRIGSASGAPGTTVAVDVRLDGAVSVAGTQLGIAYEPPLAIAATAQGRPACRAHAEAGKPSAFAFWPVGCSGAACRAVRALTLALDDVAPIADGARLFTCDVAIAADATPGSYALRAVEVGASDPDGNALPARGQSGAIRVGAAPHGGAAVRETSAGNASGCAIAGPAGDGGWWLFAGIAALLASRWIAVRCTTDRV
ncbi:MAG: hypothetical protein U0802_07360 [Candidatus Binatia bacterium]